MVGKFSTLYVLYYSIQLVSFACTIICDQGKLHLHEQSNIEVDILARLLYSSKSQQVYNLNFEA